MRNLKRIFSQLNPESQIRLLRKLRNISGGFALIALIPFAFLIGFREGCRNSSSAVNDLSTSFLIAFILLTGAYMIFSYINKSIIDQVHDEALKAQLKEQSVLAVEDWILNSETEFKYPLHLQVSNAKDSYYTDRDSSNPSMGRIYRTFETTVSGNNGLKWTVVRNPQTGKLIVNPIKHK